MPAKRSKKAKAKTRSKSETSIPIGIARPLAQTVPDWVLEDDSFEIERVSTGGRPAIVLKPSWVKRCENYAHLGLLHEEMAFNLGITLKEFRGLQERHPELRAAIKRGGPEATGLVARKMFLNAIGYEHDEEKIFCNANGKVTRVNTVKRYPPDRVSGIFYLKNRGGWKDRQEVDAGDNIKELIATYSLTLARLGLRRANSLAEAKPAGGSSIGASLTIDGESGEICEDAEEAA